MDLFDSTASVTAMSAVGAFILCLRARSELQEGPRAKTVSTGDFLGAVVAGALLGLLAGVGFSTLKCGVTASAQCGWGFGVSLPFGIAIGEILGFAALLPLRARGPAGSDRAVSGMRDGWQVVPPGSSGNEIFGPGSAGQSSGRWNTNSGDSDYGSGDGGGGDGGD